MTTRVAHRALLSFALVAATILPAASSWAATGASIASLALANVGQGACTTNTLGGTSFGTSCTGNGGSPEYWCADFALWVWSQAGVTNVSGLDAAAGSFYVYGQNNGTLSDTPAVGDAVVFDYSGGGVADHVAIVTQVNADGTIETVSGDWNGTGSTEAGFSSTSSVVLNEPAYAATVGTAPSIMGMTISGFIAPVGLSADYGAAYVSQSFPLATSALTMTAGQTIPSYIELKNTGTLAWDSNTRLGTTQPRDRDSVFADSTWISANRPAGVSGSVAPGDSYKFTFDLHAPATPGTYFEYFGVVEDGVAWFSDPGQGGPVDSDLEVQIVVVAGPGGDSDAGAVADSDAGNGTGGSASSNDAGSGSTGTTGSGPSAGQADDAGTLTSETPPSGAGAASGASASPGGGASPSGSGGGGGCAIAPASSGGGIGWMIGLAALCLFAARRSRDRARSDT
jgi:hypothetical protein